MLSRAQMLKWRNRIMQRMQEPVVGNIERRSASLKPPVPPSAASDGRALFANRLNEPFEKQHQLLAGARSQTGGDKLLVIDEVSAPVAQHSGNRNCLHLGSQL